MKSHFARYLSLSGISMFTAIAMLLSSSVFGAEGQDLLVFISAFATGNEGAIHACRFNRETGELRLLKRTTDVQQPFFTAISPDRKFLYSIHAPGDFAGKENNQVAAYEIVGSDGELKLLNRQSALGTAACYLDVDSTGKTVALANYASGSFAAFPVEPNGSLGPAGTFVQHKGSSVDPARQQEPHAHCSVVSPDNRYVYVADLGLDQILVYRLGESGKLTPAHPAFIRTPPKAGPRHLTFHPNGKQLYVINELANSVTLFDYESETGALIERQTISTLPADFTGVSHCADLKITPNRKFLYGTNRGHDSLASFRIADNGELTTLKIESSLGKGPQNLAITPDGNWLLCANMPGNNVAVFRIDSETGALKATGTPLSMPSPSCIRIW